MRSFEKFFQLFNFSKFQLLQDAIPQQWLITFDSEHLSSLAVTNRILRSYYSQDYHNVAVTTLRCRSKIDCWKQKLG